MIDITQFRTVKFKHYDKYGNLKHSYSDLVDRQKGPKSSTDIYFWILSDMPLEPTPVFSKSRKFWIPRVKVPKRIFFRFGG